MPDSAAIPPAEILLKLDKPLAGAPETGVEFAFEGVPSAFAAKPFMLTVDVEARKLDGLKLSPCAARKK
jgi:hypothetical protein